MIFDMEKPKGREGYNLLIGLVAPRPIALVTSMNEVGRLNAAPFSSYNYLCTDPPIIGMGVTNAAQRGICAEGHGEEHPTDGRVRRECGDRGLDAEDEHLRYGLSGRRERVGDGGAVDRAVAGGEGAANCGGPRRARMQGVHDDGDWPVSDHTRPGRLDLH